MVAQRLAYWYLRPNASIMAPSLAMDTWDAVRDGTHNSNTDMIYWKGDTAYEGLVMRGDVATISYYTSDITRDWPWIMGMAGPSEIRMAKVNLPSLEALAKAQ